MDDIQASFDFFYERMCDDGIYVVEDLHTCYWEEYGGNGQSQHNFIDFCKTMLDRLHAEHSRGRIASDPIASSTLSFHLYDSLAVFVRGNHGKKFAPILGGSRPHLTQS
ncbi:MAG: hypothetical protein EA356_01780 [Geminicoccaceae bacterium]|nr:MAG: hypothetical protein EA356_01780 [Geminicoccaceae bacterium]